jgi:hypothetical protein
MLVDESIRGLPVTPTFGDSVRVAGSRPVDDVVLRRDEQRPLR